MKLQEINPTGRISFQETPHDREPDVHRKFIRAARLESDGDESASDDREDAEKHNEPGEPQNPKVCDDNTAQFRHEETLDGLLERLKNAHRLDIRL